MHLFIQLVFGSLTFLSQLHSIWFFLIQDLDIYDFLYGSIFPLAFSEVDFLTSRLPLNITSSEMPCLAHFRLSHSVTAKHITYCISFTALITICNYLAFVLVFHFVFDIQHMLHESRTRTKAWLIVNAPLSISLCLFEYLLWISTMWQSWFRLQIITIDKINKTFAFINFTFS